MEIAYLEGNGDADGRLVVNVDCNLTFIHVSRVVIDHDALWLPKLPEERL